MYGSILANFCNKNQSENNYIVVEIAEQICSTSELTDLCCGTENFNNYLN